MHPADALTERLGLPIRDRDLLAQALIHSSWLHEHPDAAPGNNERLEFLGDAVVSLAVSEALYKRHPSDDEGVLSARRAAIVSTPGLARLAARLDLGSYLFLGEGEAQRGGRKRPALLASAFEALVGAIYLDLGWETARDWIHAWAAEELSADIALTSLKSPKRRLKEYTQRTTGDRPLYNLVEAVGPDHEKQFRIEVIVGGRELGVGEGPSRRIAETSAAAQALEVLRIERQASRQARAQAAKAHHGAAEAAPDGDDASLLEEDVDAAALEAAGLEVRYPDVDLVSLDDAADSDLLAAIETAAATASGEPVAAGRPAAAAGTAPAEAPDPDSVDPDDPTAS